MKKILSLVVVAAMIMAMAITSFASANATMKATVTETDTDITVAISVKNVDALTGLTAYLVTDDVKYVADSVEYGASFANWDTPVYTGKNDGIKFACDMTSTSVTSADEVVVITYKVEKVNAEKELSASDFGYGTGTLNQSKLVQEGLTAINSKKNAASFTVEYVDDRAPAAEETVWTAGAPADTTEFDAAFKFKAEDGTEKTEVAGKKLVIFGKGTPAGSLAAGDYKVVIGENEYVGLADATEYWAIVIVDEDGVRVARDSYAYTAFVNGAEAFSGVVNAQ